MSSIDDDLRIALAALAESARALALRFDQLGAALEVPRPDLDRAVEAAISDGKRVRELIHAAASVLAVDRPTWGSHQQLQDTIQELLTKLSDSSLRAGRRRIELVLGELRAGRVRHRQSTRQARLDALRLKAVSELETRLSEENVTTIAWPSTDHASWVRWVLTLEEPLATQVHERITSSWPVLEDFLTSIETESWFNAEELNPSSTLNEAIPNNPPMLAAALERSHTPTSASSAAPLVPSPFLDVDDVDVKPTLSLPTIGSDEDSASESDEIHFSNEPTYVPPEDLTVDIGDPEEDESDEAAVLASVRSSKPTRELIPNPVQVREPIELPSNLRTFESYRGSHWRGPDGRSHPAPWTDPAFEGQLEQEAERALADARWAHLLIMARAGEQLAFKALPHPDAVEMLIRMISRPSQDADRGDPRRRELLQEHSSEVARSFGLRLNLFLEALVPSEVSLPAETVQLLCSGAGFESEVFSGFVEAAFQVAAEGIQAIQVLRNLNQTPESPEDHAKQFEAARTELRQRLDEVWQTPKNLRTRHCREIWQRFMAEAQPTLASATRASPGDQSTDLRTVARLKSRYTQLADRGDAAHEDRRKMDRAARQLLELTENVIRAAQKLKTNQRRLPNTKATEDLVAAFRSLSRASNRSAREAVYVGLLDKLLTGGSTLATTLSVDDFATRPALLESIETIPAEGTLQIEVDEVVNPQVAATVLMYPGQPGGSGISLTHRLRQLERDDLLVHVEPASVRESQYAAAALTTAQVELERAIAEARGVHGQLLLSASQMAEPLSRVLAEAAAISVERPPHTVKPQILTDWVERAVSVGRRALSQWVDAFRAQARSFEPERAEAVTNALEQHRLADALALATGNLLPLPTNTLRAISTRSEARVRFPNPPGVVSQIRGEAAASLAAMWFRGLRGDQRDQELLTKFANLVFEPVLRTRKEDLRRRRGSLDALSIGCGQLREWLANTDHNPSFLPQLTFFNNIGIVTPPVPPTNETFVRRTTELVSRGTDAQIVVVLAPRITPPIRDAFRQEQRKWRGVALIDDIDLLRLLNPGGQMPDLPLGLLEIVLEQQPRWMPVSPFEILQGEQTKQEMYVGRQDEAERLAKTPSYSRVFSGRRLGKSALLKHIGDAYHGRRSLPSGNVLHVLYAPIVGIEDDDQVVDKIRRAFEQQLQHAPTLVAERADDRLKELLDSFLQKKTASLLVFLDEADMFVEAQIRRYDTDRERSLTWRMRTDFEAAKDRNELPRVRFVFAGYRATHLSEGAWANWGDVLRLQPLSPVEAGQLIAGPLARLGIDASVEASTIAFQCGYQPAVIVRFGQLLLQHLDATLTPAQRERPTITAEHVAHVFQSPALQQEIRTIAWNNFQGNPFGKVIFAALLLEFGMLPPGAVLEDAPQQVLGRLRSIEPEFLTADSVKGSPVDRVARELREFVGRSLLVGVSPTGRSYQLRFPHHLPVLLQEDQESIIRREVASLGGESDSVEIVRSMLSGSALDEVTYMLHPGSELGVRAIVAASHWMDALEAGAAKLTTRLGMLGSEVLVEGTNIRALKDNHRAVISCTPSVADAIVRSDTETNRSTPRLIVGGVDVLRWAVSRASNEPLEIASVGRLGLAQLRWWFERVRAINFAGINPGRRFLEVTGGIPFLVAALDAVMGTIASFDGATASDEDVNTALNKYGETIAEHIKRLVTGGSKISLEGREIDLLLMFAHVARMFPSDHVDVMRDWDEWKQEFPTELARIAPLNAADAPAMDVLLRLGLLPSTSQALESRTFDRLGSLSKDDPLHEIANVLLRCRST